MARIGRAVRLGGSRAFRSPVAAREALGRAITGLLQLGEVMTPEYVALADRKFRFDLAVPQLRVAVEFQGFYRGGHHGAAGLHQDCEKFCLAAAEGWLVFPVSYRMLYNVRTFTLVVEALEKAITGRRILDKPWPARPRPLENPIGIETYTGRGPTGFERDP